MSWLGFTPFAAHRGVSHTLAPRRQAGRSGRGRHDAGLVLDIRRLYFNRADPTLFVEKRMGLGYTLNLGNPWSWLVMIAFVVAVSVLLAM